MHRQIYQQYRNAILNGVLRPGQRVLSTRALADELGISRITALNAYAQLFAEGYLQSRVGAGTMVSTSLPDEPVIPSPTVNTPDVGRKKSRPVAAYRFRAESMGTPPGRRGWGPFGIGQVALEQFPTTIWNRLTARHARHGRTAPLDYGDPMGSKRLREAIADYLRTARGVRCLPEQVMIVSGSQQGLDISVRVLLEPGSAVWMEDPGYRYAERLFALNRCRIVPVPVDQEGINVSKGMALFRKARAALVTPSHQYPLGMTMPISRRLQLLDWAARNGSWIVEDDYDGEFRYESMPISSLQGLDSNSRVVYIGTFSKVLFPALRLGYVVVPADLMDAFLRVRLAMDISPAAFPQTVLADFIEEGHFSRHIRRMRVLYRERRDALVHHLKDKFGSRIEIRGEQAGMHLCVLMDGICDLHAAQFAAQAGLLLVPLSSSYKGKSSRNGFILGFGSTPASAMPSAVRRLHRIATDPRFLR